MKRYQIPFSRRYNQFRALAKRINQWLKDGSWHQFTDQQRAHWLQKLSIAYSRIAGLVAPYKLKRALAGAALLLGLGYTQSATAQISFAPPVENPFGITPNLSSYYFYPSFADMDGDGDLDLLSNGYDQVNYGATFVYYENTGTASAPQFAAPVTNPFGLVNTVSYNTPTMADIDNDGDPDILTVEDYGVIKFFENTGSSQSPQFTAPVTNPFGLAQNPASNDVYYQATFADMDGDGDLDLIIGGIYGSLGYYENTGTPNSPQFAAPVLNPNGMQLPANLLLPKPDFADLDNDGDLDLLAGGFSVDLATYTVTQELYYQENTGDANNPQFSTAVSNPFGLQPQGEAYLYVAFADIDDDGDQDLFMGTYVASNDAALFYQENTSSFNVGMEAVDIPVSLAPIPATDYIQVSKPAAWIGQSALVEVLDITGRRVAAIQLNDATVQIPLQNMPAGQYLIRLSADEQYVTRKFVKQ